MNARQALRRVVDESGKTQREISSVMGRSSGFISSQLTLGRSPGTDLMAEIAEACGYRLALVPRRKALPQGSIELTGRQDEA